MIRSLGRPISSAFCALFRAETIKASCMTLSASRGSASFAFSSIMCVASSWSRLPQFTPMRMGLSYSMAFSMRMANWLSRFRPKPHVAGIDAILGQRLGAVRVLRQQLVAVIVEIADQGRVAAQRIQPLADTHDLARRILVVHRDAHQFRAGGSQLLHLFHRRRDVGGIGIGHGLDDNRCAPTDLHRTDADRNAAPPYRKTLLILS